MQQFKTQKELKIQHKLERKDKKRLLKAEAIAIKKATKATKIKEKQLKAIAIKEEVKQKKLLKKQQKEKKFDGEVIEVKRKAK